MTAMLTATRNAFRIRDLRNKILFTLFIFILYRFGAAVPVPGVDLDAISTFSEQAANQGFIGVLNLFSGGGADPVVGVRPRDHALHHGVDHSPAAGGRHSSPAGVAGRG